MRDHRGSIVAIFSSAMPQELNSDSKQKYLGGWETPEVVLKKVTAYKHAGAKWEGFIDEASGICCMRCLDRKQHGAAHTPASATA